jgi:NAD(P)-dependent dehydrogenase (short-subunit alcohol dehydrogenase family)
VREPDQAAALVDHAVARFGRLDLAVNNAGGSPNADAATVSPRFVAKIVALNLLAPFYVAQAANAVMQRQTEGGVSINIGALVPAGRMAVPDDIADACLLLASPLAGYVSGAELRVDGGGEVPARSLAARQWSASRPE